MCRECHIQSTHTECLLTFVDDLADLVTPGCMPTIRPDLQQLDIELDDVTDLAEDRALLFWCS